MNHEQHLCWLAVGIGEWNSALGHMRVLEAQDHAVPVWFWGRIEGELDALCARWAAAAGWLTFDLDMDRDRVVEEARTWATQHLSEIEVLTEKEGST